MPTLVVFALVGLVAQLVDGSLGMAFGVTATTGLLAIGTAPAVASASVHLAELGTTVASGLSHWRFGNVDWRVVGWLAVPGAIGGSPARPSWHHCPPRRPSRGWPRCCSRSGRTCCCGSPSDRAGSAR